MSTSLDTLTVSAQDSNKTPSAVDVLAQSLDNTVLRSDAEDTQAVANAQIPVPRPRIIIYSQKQLILLSQSPLVKVPDGMPEFRAWFGELNEQALSTKKESDSLTANGLARERRYRREVEDGDASSRPTFRSTLSQPSQMGNFKHQPLRSTDRDRDAERDLRSLSDRYDRDKATRGDRLGVSAHTALLRTRERDSAPHLASDRETQRALGRKRNGESKEDWRRGAEPPRSTRDENNARQRSRVRDTSKTRDSPPSTRRDREKDRDRERFHETNDDSKRWRDDGKREEKAGSRRDKDRSGRDKDGERDRSHERGADREGRTTADDKKRNGRDRRQEDARDKEDRKDREKENEPAWMETYVPPITSGTGILGGMGADGELDSIQAWKKDMKEREMKAKGLVPEPSAPSTHDGAPDSKQPQVTPAVAESQLDEIQLFKLMMKRAQGGGGGERQEGSNASVAPSSGLPAIQETQGDATSGTSASVSGQGNTADPLLPPSGLKPSGPSPAAPSPSVLSNLATVATNTQSSTVSNGPRLLSLKMSDSAASQGDTENKDSVSSAPPFDPPRTSRLLAFGARDGKVTAQPSPQSAAAAVQMGRLQQMDPLWPSQRRPSASPVIPLSASQQTVFEKPNLQQQLLVDNHFDTTFTDGSGRRVGLEQLGHGPGLYESAPRSANPLDANREILNIDLARSSGSLGVSERTGFVSQSESLNHLVDNRRNPTPPTANYGVVSPISPFEGQPGGGQSSYASGKGSRMAKHFERQRDQSFSAARNVPNPATNGMFSNRQEQLPHANQLASGESRNIQDLLTMLNNSAQAQRSHLNQNLSQHQSMHIGPSHNSLTRHDPLLDSDDGRFAPDGLVPGLRPAIPPGPRNRDVNNGGLYANQVEDTLPFNTRLGPAQRGGIDQLFPNQVPSQFNGLSSGGGRGSLALQQQAVRGGPSPINNFNTVQSHPQQRLPPGLANLGGRPPHDPSQLIGAGAGNFGNLPSQLHAGLQHANNTQAFGQFQNPGLGVVGNQGHLRGQPGLGHVGNSHGNGLNGIEFRGAPGGHPQNQLLGLGGPPNLAQGIRGTPGFNSQQFPGPNQLPPSMNIRQQHNLQPQMLQQILPQHLQGAAPGQHNPNDLMALLMGNAPRE